MSRTRKAPSPEDTDREEDLEAVVDHVLGKRAEKRRKCLQELREQYQEMMSRFDDSDDITTDQETTYRDGVTKFFAQARSFKAGRRHARKQGHRLLAQQASGTYGLLSVKKLLPSLDIVPEVPPEDDDLSASSSDFPEIEDTYDANVHASAAHSHDNETGGIASSAQSGTGVNRVRSQLSHDLMLRNLKRKRSPAEQEAIQNEPDKKLIELNGRRRKTAYMSDYVAVFGDREVIKHRSRYYILRCEVHKTLHMTRESSRKHLEADHHLTKNNFDTVLGFFGIRIIDYVESTGQASVGRLPTMTQRIPEAGGPVAEEEERRSSKCEPITNISSSLVPVGKGLQMEQSIAMDAIELSKRPALRDDKSAANEQQVSNSKDNIQNEKEGALRGNGRSASVALVTAPAEMVAPVPLRGSSASLISETVFRSLASRKRPLELSSPTIQGAPDRPNKDNHNDAVNSTIMVRAIEQPSEAISKGATARRETPDGARRQGSEKLKPSSKPLQESPTKRNKPGVLGMKVSRTLTRPSDNEPEETSSPEPATRRYRESESQPPELPSTHDELLNMDLSQICAMSDAFEKSRLATTTTAAVAEPTAVAVVPPSNQSATGPSELNEEDQMTGLQEIIDSEPATHNCPRCRVGFWLQCSLEEHLQRCDGQMEKSH